VNCTTHDHANTPHLPDHDRPDWEFEYASGMRILIQCCQIRGKCARDVSEHFHGTKGTADLTNGERFLLNGQPPGAGVEMTNERTFIISPSTDQQQPHLPRHWIRSAMNAGRHRAAIMQSGDAPEMANAEGVGLRVG